MGEQASLIGEHPAAILRMQARGDELGGDRLPIFQPEQATEAIRSDYRVAARVPFKGDESAQFLHQH